MIGSWSIRRKLMLLLLVGFLPACGIIILSSLDHRRHEITTAENNALLVVQSMAEQQELIATGTEQMLSTLAQMPQVQGLDAKACTELFRRLMSRYPFYSIIAATTPDGNMFASSLPFDPANANISHRKHIKDAIRTLDFSAGEYLEARFSKVPSIHYAQPVFDANKKLIAIVVAAFKLDEYARFMTKTHLPEGCAMTIMDHSGMLLYRFPESGAAASKKPVRDDIFKRMSSNSDQGIFEEVDQEGTWRTYAFKQLRLRNNSPPYLYMAVGIPKGWMMHQANVEMLRDLCILGVAALVAVCLAWVLGNFAFIKPIKHLVGAAQRFGMGEMETRTGLAHTSDEMGQLAQSFDSMAFLLEVRDAARRHAEQALRESEERWQFALEGSGDGVWDWNVETGEVFFSPRWKAMLGYEEKEIGAILDEHDRRLHPDDRQRVYEDLDRHFRGETPFYQNEHRLLCKDGNYKWILDRGKVIQWSEDGRPLRVIGAHSDITERKRAEEEMREKEAKYRMLFEMANDGILLLDMTGFVDCNQRAANMYGLAKEDIIGRFPADLSPQVQPDGRASSVASAEKVLAALGGAPQFFEWRSLRSDGVIFDTEFSLNRTEVGGLVFVQAIVRDVTERKRAKEEKEKLEAQLFQAQKMESVGRLAGGVAHDFNNMLSVIIGRTEMALQSEISSDELRLNLQEILRAGQHSADLTRQLLAFARKQTAAPRILDLNDTVSGLLKMLRRLIGEDISLHWEPGRDLWKVKIDPSQVGQILANLVVNARDAVLGAGSVAITTENIVIDDSRRAVNPEFVPGDYVLLTVSDTGAGMSTEVCEKIFEPFFTTKELGKGTGLGLSTVYGIVKQNEGFIYVESQPGKGATFKIYLPRFDAADAQVSCQEEPGGHPTGTETILLVEDDGAILLLTRLMLEKLGYTVISAQSPAQAISLAGKHQGDLHLLITDVVMPEMNGRELVEKLRAMRPGLKCLYMSGYTFDVIAHRGILDEAVNFIEKPFSLQAIAQGVRKALLGTED